MMRTARLRFTPRIAAVLEDMPKACRPFVHETQYFKSLHFSWTEVQSRMLKRAPDRLIVDYTRTMMGFLMFNHQPNRIAMLGLGGGSLAKFCHRELPLSRIDVVEINPHVVALRDEFHVPPDDERFHVHLGDGARFIEQSTQQFDVLLVDAYTREGIAPRLASQAFYNSCRHALSDNGIMIVNLYCEDADTHIDRIRRSFHGVVFAVEEKDHTNQVVFACAGDAFYRQQLGAFEASGYLSTPAWAVLKPVFCRIASVMQKKFGIGLPAPA
jgi:spermidine synthase